MLTGVIKVNECLWQKKGTAYVNNLGNLCIEALEMLFFAVVVICDFFIYFIVFFFVFFFRKPKTLLCWRNVNLLFQSFTALLIIQPAR